MNDLNESLTTIGAWKDDVDQIKTFSELVIAAKLCLSNGGTLIFCGNGGSSAMASHLAAEFICKVSKTKIPLRSISLTESPTSFSAISNDFGFEHTVTRQLMALANSEDLVIFLSTSGSSTNIVKGIEWVKENNIKSSLWTSLKYEGLNNIVDFLIKAPTFSTARAQELHLVLGHILAQEIENDYLL
jgi:D-sedoheptulose 7-phosphate isomerase